MLDVLKQSLKPFDFLILIAAVFLFSKFDYDNLAIIDIIYIISFTLWFIMMFIKIYILYRKRRGN